MGTHFSPAALKFLGGLKRHNDRVWFDDRKTVYEAELKAPLLAVIDEINQRLLRFAPQHVRPPNKIMMRIYRDVRFSKSKLPYKTNVSAWWSRRGLEKTSGGGFYFDLSDSKITIAAGVYMPEREQLLAIRRHLLTHHQQYRTILGAKKMRALLEPMNTEESAPMKRPPKGFAPDHPAIDLVMQRQWGVACTLPAASALSPDLVPEIVARFKLAAPLVALLNEPLTSLNEAAKTKPLLF